MYSGFNGFKSSIPVGEMVMTTARQTQKKPAINETYFQITKSLRLRISTVST